MLIHGGSLGGTMNIFCVDSNANTIKGLVIAYGPGAGISIVAGASGNIIIDNYIGTDRDGDWTWPNETGILISSGANGNVIAHNVISGNSHNGILVSRSGTDNNMIRRNYIGLDREGKSAVPNGWDAVFITNGARQNDVAARDTATTSGETVYMVSTSLVVGPTGIPSPTTTSALMPPAPRVRALATAV